jgi:histidine ammonia-lyase
MGLQGLQFVATSTAAHNQSLGFPHSLHTISTNGDNQDIVSMGTDAALIADRAIRNAYIVAAIELVVVSQAMETLHEQAPRFSSESRRLISMVRQSVPPIYEDRTLTADMRRLTDMLMAADASDWAIATP